MNPHWASRHYWLKRSSRKLLRSTGSMASRSCWSSKTPIWRSKSPTTVMCSKLAGSRCKTNRQPCARTHKFEAPISEAKSLTLYMSAASQTRRQFASDNYAGICHEAFAAMVEANHGHEVSYGNDNWTEKAANLIRDIFEPRCEIFFVFNGTSANSLSLASLCQSYHSILCHELAHVEVAECGAPEFFANGTKVLLLDGEA